MGIGWKLANDIIKLSISPPTQSHSHKSMLFRCNLFAILQALTKSTGVKYVQNNIIIALQVCVSLHFCIIIYTLEFAVKNEDHLEMLTSVTKLIH